MSLTFNVQLKSDHFKDDLRDLLYNDSSTDSHLRNLSDRKHFPVKERLGQWAWKPSRICWKDTTGFIFPIECPLTPLIPQLIVDLDDRPIIICTARPGAGKTIVAPVVAQQYFERRAFKEGLSLWGKSFKGLHIMPTGEQAHQASKFIRDAVSPIMKVGCFTSSLSGIGKANNFLDNDTNYLFTTHTYAIQTLATIGVLHVVVIDEVNELTPSLLQIFRLIKQKFNNKQLTRVMMLSSNLSKWLLKKIKNYFREDNIGIIDPNIPQYFADIISYGSDDASSKVAQLIDGEDVLKDGVIDEQALFLNEQTDSLSFDVFIRPNVDKLTDRAVEVAFLITEDLLERKKRTDNIPPDSGIIVFLPSAREALHAYNNFCNLRERFGEPAFFIDVYLVNSESRHDLHVLTTKATGLSIRVFSTPVLGSGVTLLGIKYIIDTGILTIPDYHNIRGINKLVSLFMDQDDHIRRMGRLSRITTGSYHEMFTRERSQNMRSSDWQIIKLMTSFNTSNLSFMLSFKRDQFMEIDDRVYQSLMLEVGLQGLFNINLLSSNRQNRFPLIDSVGVALSRALPGISLDAGIFLLNCATLGVLLSGVIYVASYLSRHSSIKKSNLPIIMTEWCSRSGTMGSDFEVYSEILLNIWLKYGGRVWSEHTYQDFIVVHSSIDKLINPDGIWELNRFIRTICNGLISLKIIPKIEDLFDYRYSGLCKYTTNGYGILKLAEERKRGFCVAIVSSFGSRVACHVNDETAPSVVQEGSLFNIESCSQPGAGHSQLIRSERSEMSSQTDLAVYHTFFDNNDDDKSYLTGLIHPCSPLQFLVHGNVYGSYNDTVNRDDLTLTIHTCTGSLLFKFPDFWTLNVIADYRKKLKLLTSVILDDQRLCEHLFHLSDFDFNIHLSVTRVPDAPPVETINRWQDCYGVY